MAYTPPQPPTVNGLPDWVHTDEKRVLEVKSKLEVIQASFEPNEYFQVCTKDYVVPRYNDENVGEEINGTTYDFIIGYSAEETE